jgi:hypothetical protein
MPSGPVMKTCQPSSTRPRALAIAAAALKRIVVAESSPREACTMKVTANPFCAMHSSTSRCGGFQGAPRSSNFHSSEHNPGDLRPSGKRARACLDRHSVKEILQRLFSRHVRRAMRAEAALPQFDTHRSALAAYFPIPAIPDVPCSGNGDVE